MSEQLPAMQITVSPDNSSISIGFRNGNNITLNPTSLSDFIRLLCQVRGQIKEISDTNQPSPGQVVISSSVSRFYVESVKNNPGKIMLAVFHPGPGWVGAVLEQSAAGQIRDLIEYSANLVSTH